MLILDRQRWLTQPDYPTEVDATHPLAAGLGAFFYPAGGFWWDAVLRRSSSSDDSTIAVDSRIGGYARDYSNQQTQFAHAPDYALTGNEGMTVAVMLDADALTNTGHLISKGTNDAGSPWYLRLGVTGGDNSQIDFSRGDNASAYMRYRTGASDMFSAPASDVLVAVTCAGNNMYYDPPTIWVDDVATVKTVGSYWTFGGSGVTDVADGGSAVYIGKNSAGTSYLDGRIKRIVLANRPWTQDELREFRFAPYALLRKRRTPTVYSVSSAPTGTLSGTLAALTLSSNATVANGAGATLSGTLAALTLSSSATVANGVGGTLSGTLAALTLSSNAAVGTGASASVSTTLETLTLSSSATVANGVGATLSGTLGALTLSSNAAVGTLPVDATLAGTLGALTLSSSATVANGVGATLAATLGALTVSSAASVTTPGSDATATLAGTLGALVLSSAATVNAAADIELPRTRRIGGARLQVVARGAVLRGSSRIGPAVLRRAA